jgi:molybdopterin-guanine dinucleotide biosynthesis protein A
MRATSDPRAGGSSRPDREGRADVCGVVLCGGASRRMGADKARLELGGRSLLLGTVERLEAHCRRVVLACGSAPRYAELGRELVLDATPTDGAVAPAAGPLAGILSALDAIEAERFLVLACDMPRASAELFDALLERSDALRPDVLFFESERGVEPLCAVYHRRCRHPMRAAASAGERRVLAFLDHPLADGAPVHAERLREGELAPELRARDSALNLNTLDELQRERVRWQEEQAP